MSIDKITRLDCKVNSTVSDIVQSSKRWVESRKSGIWSSTYIELRIMKNLIRSLVDREKRISLYVGGAWAMGGLFIGIVVTVIIQYLIS